MEPWGTVRVVPLTEMSAGTVFPSPSQAVTVENHDVVFILIGENMRLRGDVILHRDIVVEVFLIQVENHADMGRVTDKFELVAGHFKHHRGVVVDAVDVIEAGDADVAHKDGVVIVVFEQMIEQGRGGAFALGAGDAEGILAKGGQKDFGLRSQTVKNGFGMKDGNAGAFENPVEALKVDALCLGVPEIAVRIGAYVDRLAVGKRQVQFGINGADIAEGGDTFAPHAPDDDVFVFDE